MASPAKPGAQDGDRGNNPTEPADPNILADAAREPVLQGGDFPSGGGDGVLGPGGIAPTASRGSTGRGATDDGKTDSEGVPGGGSAGSAGG